MLSSKGFSINEIGSFKKAASRSLASWLPRVLIALVFASCMLAGPGAEASPASESFIRQKIDAGYTILNSSALSPNQRHRQFHDLFIELVDTRRVGIFTLGQYAKAATPDDTDAFVAAFTNYLVAVYETALSKYDGQILKVTGSSDPKPNDSVVNIELAGSNHSNGVPIKAAFRVRVGANGEPTITDLQVEGMWLAIAERADFTAYLQQHNGSIAELTKRLNALSDQLIGESNPRS
jgi:phospholipid transport system substrate-binding protein